MKISEPQIEEKQAQNYVAIRTQVPMEKLSEVIPQYIDETEAWLTDKGHEPVGVPIVRYHIIDMESELDIEVGWCTQEAVLGDERISSGIIPAGKYGTLTYTDVNKGIEGNGALIQWAEANDIEWDAWDDPKGHAFRSRVEYMLDGPDDDPNPTNWRTEVAILIANKN